jgi:miniconductance mechanosensitive channel
VQLVKIIIYLVSLLIVVSVIFKKDISVLLTGIGAMAAVLILVFKDTLLGLVASIQLSANEMLKIGDWITIPGRSVDGLVTDITLTTVKIQNFDKTIITVPTYALVNESFQNWKGMEEAGIRQIKRSVNIDMTTICFPGQDLYGRLSRIPVLKNHLQHKGEGSRITNLGLFRIYTEEYLRKHPYIDSSQPVVVRHRQTDGNGLPLEIYAFSKLNQFISFENLQSELFEHLIAVMDDFGLKVFQQPSGHDMVSLSTRAQHINLNT